MRTPALIAIAALAGFGIAWLLLMQVPETPAPAPVAAPVAPVQAPVHEAPPPTPAPVAEVETRKTESPPASAAPAPVPGKPPPPAASEVAPAPAAAEPEATPDETEVPAEEVPAEEESAEEEGAPPPIDADQAADLLADLIARQEAATEENGLPNVSGQTWKQFEDEQADPEWSEPTARQIEQTLDQWIAGLPEGVRNHIAVIHIECRATLCQILAADNDIDTQNERAQAGQEWQQAIATLPMQAWWNELGFTDSSTQVTATEGHTLYMTYLRREVKPPPS